MGQRLIALGSGHPEFQLVGAIEHALHPKLGTDAGLMAGIGPIGLAFSADFPERPDVVIDFSVPQAAEAIALRCVDAGIPLVVATTGLSTPQQEALRAAGEKIPLVWAPSMSLAVNLSMKLCQVAGKTLKNHASGVDVEIIERHHRFKEDAPSGTALKFGQVIAETMGQSTHVHGREGRPGPRPPGEIAYHAVRVGDNPGEHTIIFGMLGETIELRVAATNRDCYAHGALAAARFLVGQKPGLYGMEDVLGL